MPETVDAKYTCTRCREVFYSEDETLEHLEDRHEGKSDGKYDYAVNITSEFP